jgi:hypothetical protein
MCRSEVFEKGYRRMGSQPPCYRVGECDPVATANHICIFGWPTEEFIAHKAADHEAVHIEGIGCFSDHSKNKQLLLGTLNLHGAKVRIS